MSRKRFEIISSAFDRKGLLIASSLNSYSKSHPLQLFYSKLAGMSDQRVYLHSELATLIKAKKPVHALLVQRFDSKGKPALAMPCKSCLLAIKAYGVQVLRYTTVDGIVEMNVN